MKPQEAHDLIRAACLRRPELCFSDSYVQEAKEKNIILPNFKGFCYIASQVFAYLTGAEVWTTDTKTHYWNALNGEVWDLTKEQFDFEFRYHDAYKNYKVPRKNKLTARAKELLDETLKAV